MIRTTLLLLLLVTVLHAHARRYEVPPGDVAGFFATLPEDATVVSFSQAAVYHCAGDIILPKRRMLIIDGAGATLKLGPTSHGFVTRVIDQKEAMRRMGNRYVIRDFAVIEGGRKAIDLQATLGSVVSNCRLVGQTEVAVDLRFCLMCRLEMVLVTNPKAKGIVLRQGDWPGATATNSQCNSTVLEQCRVYCTKTTTQAFTILNSGGVRMSDCISEGGPPDHDVFLSASANGDETASARNPVVKSFRLENFHVEHKARIASVHVNMPSRASVVLSNIYWNGPQTAPVVYYMGGQLNLMDIGWFNRDFRIHTRMNTPRINAERCNGLLKMGEKERVGTTQAGVLMLVDPYEPGSQLKLNYVRVSKPSM
jgi:hypothetical protein